MDKLLSERETREPVRSRGTFYCAYDTELAVFLFISGLLLFGIVFVFSRFRLVAGLDTVLGYVEIGIYGFEIIILGVWAFLNIGRECEYEALETEFIIRGPGRKQEIFYYSDIRNIEFDIMRRLGPGGGGYLVTITTGVRKIKYRYIFGENKVLTGISGTPFYYLALNSGFKVEE